MKLKNKEVGQILAALRLWQTSGWANEECIREILDEHGYMCEEEIDDLCERLNTEEEEEK